MIIWVICAGVAIYGPIDERGIQLTRHDLDKCGGRYSCGPLRPYDPHAHVQYSKFSEITIFNHFKDMFFILEAKSCSFLLKHPPQD